MWTALALLALLTSQDSQAPVRLEFRVFAGDDEITSTTRVRLRPTGTRSDPVLADEGKRLRATVAPGIYDVQALRMRPEGIVAIRWAERLVIMHYPDEAGGHLEVINFDEEYGALQLRAAKSAIAGYDLGVFPAGDRAAAAPEAAPGDDYRLFILKAGRYDIRVRPAGAADNDAEARWHLDVEVPASRTRMKIVDGS